MAAAVESQVVQKIAKYEFKNAKPGSAPFSATSKYAAQQIIDTVRAPKTSISNIPFADMSVNSYKSGNAREIQNYKIDTELTTGDRVVYVSNDGSHAVVAFRGTNPKNWRDITTDALLGANAKDLSNRFWNAERVTSAAINKYGKGNVYATGHSLGGSQAMHVSQKYGIHAEAYNPFVSLEDAFEGADYSHSVVHYNAGDPIGFGIPFVTTKHTYYHYNWEAGAYPFPIPFAISGIKQHGISNLTSDASKPIPRPSPPTPTPPDPTLSEYSYVDSRQVIKKKKKKTS